MNPVVTIIIPTYKRPKLLKRAILSALNQTYQHIKVCVYDDSSGDETASVVETLQKTDSRISYFCQKVNLGVVGNVRTGFSEVDSPLFMLHADDDILLPEFIESTVDGFKSYPEAMFSAAQIIFITDKGDIHNVSLLRNFKKIFYTPPEGILTLLKDPNVLAGVVFRKEVLEKVGTYDEEVDLISDWDYMFRIAYRYPFVVTQTPGVLFIRHSDNASIQNEATFRWTQWERVIQKIEKNPIYQPEMQKSIEWLLRRQFRRMLIHQAKTAVINKKFNEALLAANVFRDSFKEWGKYFYISFLALFSRFFPPFHAFLKFNKKRRDKRKKRENEHLQNQYGHYKSYFS
jgi:glycosyltransferase involved in cell wall biosynthesis